MNKILKGLIRETIFFIITIILFVIFLIISRITFLAKFEFSLFEYSILILNFSLIYIIFQIFIYFLNKEINIEERERNKIYLIILGFLSLSTYIFCPYFNILNPIKYIADIFIYTIIFNVFQYIKYLILILILISILLLIKLINKIIDLRKSKVQDKKIKRKTKKMLEEEKENKIKKIKNLQFYLILIFLIILSIGLVLKIYKLNTIYIINLDNNNLIATEIKDAYKDINFTRILDLSKIEKAEQKNKMVEKLIYEESESLIIIPNGYLNNLKECRENKGKVNLRIIYITKKDKNRNIEYKVLLDRMRQLGITYEQFCNFTETKELINREILKNRIKVKK